MDSADFLESREQHAWDIGNDKVIGILKNNLHKDLRKRPGDMQSRFCSYDI